MSTPGVFSVRDGKRLLGQLIAFEVSLVVIFLAETLVGSPSATFHALFNLDGEGTIPAWFSTVQLFSIGLVCLLKAWRLPVERGVARRCLAVLGAGFAYLSADESAAIHEKITAILAHISWIPRFAGSRGVWIFVYAVIGIGVAAVLLRPARALWRNDCRTALMFVVGLGVMLTGGVGFEIIGYHYPRGTLLYQFETAIEEFFEMAGASILLCGSLRLTPDKLEEVAHRTVFAQDNLPA